MKASIFLEICTHTQILGPLVNFTIGLKMYISPSSNCSLLTLNLPFKVILRRFEVIF